MGPEPLPEDLGCVPTITSAPAAASAATTPATHRLVLHYCGGLRLGLLTRTAATLLSYRLDVRNLLGRLR